jgi:excisionase family DNA binding protein
MDERYFSIRQLAAQLGVSHQMIRRKIKRGEIAAIRLSRKCIRIPKSEVERLIDGKAKQRG